MKVTELKKFIKEAVKESMTEVLGEILLEALRNPKQSPIIKESYTPQVDISSNPKSALDARKAYEEVLQETSLNFTSNDVQRFSPQGIDPLNGTLPQGDLGMDQIMNLMKVK